MPRVTGGEWGYRSVLAAGSPSVGPGKLLLGGLATRHDGGRVERYSANAEWRGTVADGSAHGRAQAYALKYRMQLYSNFTYFFMDPDDSDPGTPTLADQQPDDQFNPFDDHWVYGLNTSRACPALVGAIRAGSRNDSPRISSGLRKGRFASGTRCYSRFIEAARNG